MKHLKNYVDIILNNRVEIPMNVVYDIRDICLELTDVGFGVFTNQLRYNKLGKREGGFYPNMEIFRKKEPFYFKIDEVQEVIDRISHYMKSIGYSTTMEVAESMEKSNRFISHVKISFNAISFG